MKEERGPVCQVDDQKLLQILADTAQVAHLTNDEYLKSLVVKLIKYLAGAGLISLPMAKLLMYITMAE